MSNDISKLLIVIVLSVFLADAADAQTNAWSTQDDSECSDQFGSFDAFIPGMRGKGTCNRGGFVPGTNVIVVTNLNATGPGSFDNAMSQSCPKVVLFGVAGLVQRNGRVNANSCDNWSIVGSSSPGGFSITGTNSSDGPLFRPNNSSNWTIGHITFAGGDNESNPNGGTVGNSGNRGSISLSISGGNESNGLAYNNNFIWGNDETITCWIGSGEVSNFTWWQNVIGIPTNGSGVHIINDKCKHQSIIRNFYIYAHGRHPLADAHGTFVSNNYTANSGYENIRFRPCNGSNDNPFQVSSIHNLFARGRNSSGHSMTSNTGSSSCTNFQVYEIGSAEIDGQNQNIKNCNNHGCTSGVSGSELQSTPISSVYPTGYVPETITQTQQGILDFATQLTDFAGAFPKSRLPYLSGYRDEAISMITGVGDIGGWRADLDYPSGAEGGGVTIGTDGEGGIASVTPPSGNWDPTDGSDIGCDDMPTGSTANAITTSGLTRLHEWAIGCFMDNVMPVGYREDKLEFYSIPSGGGSGSEDVQPNAPGNLNPSP